MELKPSHQIGTLSEVEQQAVDLRADGATMREVMVATGLNHSQAERAIMKATLTEADVTRFMAGGQDLGSRAVAGRAAKISWGVMGILAGVPESQVRKAYEQAASLKSKGQRIGHGGRFHYDEAGQPLYADELKPTGTSIPLGVKYEGALAQAFTQRLGRLDKDARDRIAEQYGIATKGKKPQTVVNLILKAAADVKARNEARLEALAPKELESAS